MTSYHSWSSLAVLKVPGVLNNPDHKGYHFQPATLPLCKTIILSLKALGYTWTWVLYG